MANVTTNWAQNLSLLDTLNSTHKKALADRYKIRQTTFYSQLDAKYGVKQAKEMKTIFDDSFAELQKSIQKNELLHNSPFNTYLNDLVAEIRTKNPTIPKKLSILVSRDYETNAHNRGEGTIIVNQYLLEALDNEDQLLFILCHEIAHQRLNHVVNSVHDYVTTNNSEELKQKTKDVRKQKYGRKTSAFELLKELKYKRTKQSRRKEIEADSLGYIYYANLDRSPKQVAQTLQNLRDSDIEKDSLTVKDYQTIFASFGITSSPNWFEMERFDNYHYQKQTKFNTDSLRTHPDCDVRIEKLILLEPAIQNNIPEAKATVSADFDQWKKSVVYQNIRNEYLMQHYGNSLYEALKLYNRQPSALLREWIAENVTKLYEAKKAYQLNRYVNQVNVNKYTSSYNLFSTLVFNLSLEELQLINQKIKPTNQH